MILVRKLECRYYAPSDHPAPESFRARLDDAVEREFPAALAAAFPSSLPAGDESLWMIRRVDFALESSGEWSSDEFARSWAGQAARTIVQTMFSPDSAGNVLYFPDRAAYLAQLLTDLAHGSAWSKWYYHAFDGLRLLDTAAALSAALTRDRDESLRALPRIAPQAFQRILSTLLSQHAESVWTHLQPRRLGPLQPSTLAQLCDLWNRDRHPALPTLEHRALWLLHAISSEASSLDAAIPAVRVMAALEEARILLRPDSYRDLLSALDGNDYAGLARTAGIRLAEWLAPLLDHPGEIQALDATLRQQAGVASATCFGAAFLLLPAIADFPATQSLRFAIFRRCCPPALHTHIERDPLLRDLFQVDAAEDQPPIDSVALHQSFLSWLAALDLPEDRGHWLDLPAAPHPDLDYFSPIASPEDRALCLIARALLRNFAWRLPGFAKSSLAHLWQNFLDLQARMQTFDDRRVVRLTAPPLHVVLAMTGLLTSTFHLPWLDSRPFCLFPER
jgi:hypothetical protein